MDCSLQVGQVSKPSASQSLAAALSLHRPAGPTWSQHTHLTGGQSQGAGEGPGQQEAPPAVAVSGRLSLQEALLLLLLGAGLLLGARSVALALLALAFCLHPWT